MRKAVIFDIDGTLANNDHRRHLVEGAPTKDWEKFFSLMHLDEPKEHVRYLFNSFPGKAIFMVTGRFEKYRHITMDWLVRHKFDAYYSSLYMRPDGDFRPDVEFKRGVYERDIKPHFDVTLVLEDRTSVVKMWRSLGLECWQVAEGEF